MCVCVEGGGVRGEGGYLWVCNNVMRFSFLYIAASYTHVHSFSCILLVAIYIYYFLEHTT